MGKNITLHLEVFGPNAGESHTEEFQWNTDMPLPQYIQVKRIEETPSVKHEWPPSAQHDPRLDWDTHVTGRITFYRADHFFETVYLISNQTSPYRWSA